MTFRRRAAESGRRHFGGWGTDSIALYARSAPPVNVVTGLDVFDTGFLSGVHAVQRPNLISGVPLWIANPDVAGGEEINEAAFAIPIGGSTRKSWTQCPARVRRYERGFDAAGGSSESTSGLLFRREGIFFNIFNHPNFGPPINYMSSPQFGQSTQMLSSLGSGGQNGGLNPLYQIGGPRSAQLALKLLF